MPRHARQFNTLFLLLACAAASKSHADDPVCEPLRARLSNPSGWMVSKMSSQELRAQTQQNVRAVHCQYVRDELIGTENAALYAFHDAKDAASGKPSTRTRRDALHVPQRMTYGRPQAPSVSP